MYYQDPFTFVKIFPIITLLFLKVGISDFEPNLSLIIRKQWSPSVRTHFHDLNVKNNSKLALSVLGTKAHPIMVFYHKHQNSNTVLYCVGLLTQQINHKMNIVAPPKIWFTFELLRTIRTIKNYIPELATLLHLQKLVL